MHHLRYCKFIALSENFISTSMRTVKLKGGGGKALQKNKRKNLTKFEARESNQLFA